jgi:uncharacterized ferritin-like protein (DUF455 family)
MKASPMTIRRTTEYWSAQRAATSMSELAYCERALAHILAGWIPKIPDLRVKSELGQHIFQAFDRANQLRRRSSALSRADAAAPAIPEGYRAVMMRVDGARNTEALLAALYHVIFPHVTLLYREHIARTDPIGDGSSLRLVGLALPEVEARVTWGKENLHLREPAAHLASFLEELRSLWDARRQGAGLSWDNPLWKPLDRVHVAARPAEFSRCEPGSLGLLPVDSMRDPRDIAMLLHADLDEEYTTLELIARNSYEHPEMPWQFHFDMARHASDEARHARLISRLLEERGFGYGDFSINTSSYDGLYQFAPCEAGSRKELLWRMLIRQTFMEGLALDSLAHESKRREVAGQQDISCAFDYIVRDEIFHTESGLRWSRHLLGDDPRAALQERYEALKYFTALAESVRARFAENNLETVMAELVAIEEGKRRRGGKLPERPLNYAGRREAGFTEVDIQQILDWGYATLEPGTVPSFEESEFTRSRRQDANATGLSPLLG